MASPPFPNLPPPSDNRSDFPPKPGFPENQGGFGRGGGLNRKGGRKLGGMKYGFQGPHNPGRLSENQEAARPRCNQVVVGTLHISLLKLYTEQRCPCRIGKKEQTKKRKREKKTFPATNSIHSSSKSCWSTSCSHLMEVASSNFLGIGVVGFLLTL